MTRIKDINPIRTSGVERVISALNPIKFISDNIEMIVHCTLEIKKINAEIAKVHAERDVQLEKISATKEVLLQTITERKNVLLHQFELIEKKLEDHHVERMKILDSINNITDQCIGQQLPSEDKQFAMETIKLLTESLKHTGELSENGLQQLAATTIKSIETISQYNILQLKE